MIFRPRLWCILALAFASFVRAGAHEAFAEYIWHRVQLSANSRHIDVTIELTFFETWSSRERQRMDANRDGCIQRSEIHDYTSKLAHVAGREIGLRIAGRPVALIPLYAPEVNLLGRDSVEGGHHQLTLRFFATSPKEFTAGTAITVDDRLWPEARCLTELSTAGEGVDLLTEGKVAERPFPATAGDAVHFTAHYIKSTGDLSHPR